VLYGKDCKEINESISREGMLKYMDGIIEELMFKIKEHLFLLRKELDVKMGMYFNSKPVDKIRSALNGINKCLEERFLDLRHEEI
jgi:cob(I)alamin adenosyltransferase